jgi:propanol-preferring alcohol dehydrogenase
MRAVVLEKAGLINSSPLRVIERDVPVPGPGELLIRVEACGICHTDLHTVEGDIIPNRSRPSSHWKGRSHGSGGPRME